jgi:hypothetical protein
MNPVPPPDDLDTEVIAVDQALDALARRHTTMSDPAMSALADFAQAIDDRAIALEATRPAAHTSTGRAKPAGLNGYTVDQATVTTPTAPLPGHRIRTRPATRTRLTRIATPILAAAAAVILIATLPFNSSASSPLHPLHQLLFQPNTPPAAQTIRLSLASAREALDRATPNNPATPTELDRARRLLAEARGELAQVTDPDTRSELENELTDLENRANRIEGDQHGPGTDTAGSGQNGQGEGGQGNTADPTHDPQNQSGGPSSSPQNTDDARRGG